MSGYPLAFRAQHPGPPALDHVLIRGVVIGRL